MALNSLTKILIDGEEIQGYNSLSLRQQIDDHHTLEVVFPRSMLESIDEGFGNGGVELLGKAISISVEPDNDSVGQYGTLKFKGIIAQLRLVKGASQGGDKIVVLAKSPTLSIDDGPHCNCYTEKSLAQIVREILETINGLDLTIDAHHQDSLPYVVQHNQSNFDFVSQLAARYGEWNYYDGEAYIFGKPGNDELELSLNFDLKEYDISLVPIAQLFTYYNRDYSQDDVVSSATNRASGVGTFGNALSSSSTSIFGNTTNVRAFHFGEGSGGSLSAITERQGAAQAINQVVLRGTSDNPGVKLGSVIVVEGARYRVVEVSHVDHNYGNYQNTFQAVAGGEADDAYPKMNINAFPFCHSELGRVTDTNDPQSLGRIKVRLPWMSGNQETPWVRFLTAHAGADRGQFIIPEIDDEVLVGFEGGNAEAPVILGSLWNHQGSPPGEWTNPENDFKVFQTREGNVIKLCDTSGSKSITIEDGEGNKIIIDSSAGSISISANSEIKLTSEKITLDASNELNIKSGQKTTVDAGVELSTKATNISNKADAKLENQGAVVEIKGNGMTNIDGGTVFIKGKAAITVQAGIVNLN